MLASMLGSPFGGELPYVNTEYVRFGCMAAVDAREGRPFGSFSNPVPCRVHKRHYNPLSCHYKYVYTGTHFFIIYIYMCVYTLFSRLSMATYIHI